MKVTSHGTQVIDLGQTAKKHKSIAQSLLAAHSESGCDTLGRCQGTKEGTMMNKTLERLSSLRMNEGKTEDVLSEAITLVSSFYHLFQPEVHIPFQRQRQMWADQQM